ncbi:Hsp20/alpha crystallin family protein [soil metagenome]
MAHNPWELVRELASMQDRMQRVWGGLYDRRRDYDRGGEDVTSRGSWLPAVDIYGTDGKDIVLRADLAGLKREDIDLTVENNTLTIKGQRRPDDGVREEQYHRLERAYGPFSRSFTLPNTVEPERVRAEYRDGVLTVTLPVRQEARPRQIQVELQD